MYKRISSLIIAIIFISFGLKAQTLGEALQYSFYSPVGTARTAGAGGAFGALGGDQGGIIINPATLATFRKGEFIISPTYFSSASTSDFQGSKIQDNSAVDITAINMGLVFTSSPRNSKWITSNLGISYTKLTDFERNMRFSGTSEGTIMQRFAERANGNDLNQLDDFEAGVAYDAEALIGPDDNLIYAIDPVDGQMIRKAQSIKSNGGMSELSIAWAGNYNDIIHLGFSLGIPFSRYETTKSYTEEAEDGKSAFRSLNYNEYLKTTGSGLNVKLGIIATPIKSLRIGASLASPTTFTFSDEYNTSMVYNYVDNVGTSQTGSSESPDGYFDYEFRTPWKTTGSIAYLFRNEQFNGFLSAEIDYLDYTNNSYDLLAESENPADLALQDDLNNQINVQLKDAVNVRLGAEIAIDIFRIRGGYQLNGSPFYKDEGKYFSGISIGGGLRFDKFFFDMAYKVNGVQQSYIPYLTTNIDDLQLVGQDISNTYLTTTFGFKF